MGVSIDYRLMVIDYFGCWYDCGGSKEKISERCDIDCEACDVEITRGLYDFFDNLNVIIDIDYNKEKNLFSYSILTPYDYYINYADGAFLRRETEESAFIKAFGVLEGVLKNASNNR